MRRINECIILYYYKHVHLYIKPIYTLDEDDDKNIIKICFIETGGPLGGVRKARYP